MEQTSANSYNITSGNHTKVTESILNTTSIPTGCLVIQYGEFIPWNNPDNIVSQEAENLTRILKDLVFLPILFLIGCPANIINMVVFYKQGLKERINVCLFALSLADGLYLINNMLWFGEQLYLQFTTKEVFGPVLTFMVNNRLVVFQSLIWISQVLSAIIACERCFCVTQPHRSQTVLPTSTMTVIIVVVSVVIMGLFILVVFRHYLTCAYDPLSNTVIMTVASSEFFKNHPDLIIYLEVLLFGGCLPGLVIFLVITTTIITAIKLRQAAAWRAGTSSSTGLSQRDIALTRMLVGNSFFFIACVFPFIVLRFVFLLMPDVNNGRRQHNFYIMIQYILIVVSYFNSTFNIVIYYTMGSRYRETFWQLFRREKK